MLSRRTFLTSTVLGVLALRAEAKEFLASDGQARREALHYQKLGDGKGTVRCGLCPRRCTIASGNTGFCRARKNLDGTLYSLGYALPCAIHVDPVEKKPFYQFYPKSTSFSLACAGCNLRCKFCQNWEISQLSPLDAQNSFLPAAHVPAMAQLKGSRSVAFTYTEPTTFYEYMLDTARANRAKGLLSVYHSNGYINQEPLLELVKYLDAANIDLKGFSDQFYGSVCEATLGPVLETLKTLRGAGVWLEITNLVIPGYNDDPQMIAGMSRWINENLGADTPLHFSRFFPLYRMTAVPPTPVPTLDRARAIAQKAGLRYVYVGNVPGHSANSTYCPKCLRVVLKRAGFSVVEANIKGGRCGACGEKIAGVGLLAGGTKI